MAFLGDPIDVFREYIDFLMDNLEFLKKSKDFSSNPKVSFGSY